MNKKILILFSLLIILGLMIIALLFFARQKSPTPSPEPSQKEQVNYEIIEVDKTKNFSVVLDSNPTTGYQWEAKFDESFIKLVSSNFTSSPELTNTVGSAGTQNFEFSALKSGETEITFYYFRAWEKDNPTEVKIYKVKIL